MRANNEWELLCIAEDIEVGDTLRVEIHQAVELMVLVSATRQIVTLMDRNRVTRVFKSTTLEGFGGPGYLMGKSKVDLKLTDLGRVG